MFDDFEWTRFAISCCVAVATSVSLFFFAPLLGRVRAFMSTDGEESDRILGNIQKKLNGIKQIWYLILLLVLVPIPWILIYEIAFEIRVSALFAFHLGASWNVILNQIQKD